MRNIQENPCNPSLDITPKILTVRETRQPPITDGFVDFESPQVPEVDQKPNKKQQNVSSPSQILKSVRFEVSILKPLEASIALQKRILLNIEAKVNSKFNQFTIHQGQEFEMRIKADHTEAKILLHAVSCEPMTGKCIPYMTKQAYSITNTQESDVSWAKVSSYLEFANGPESLMP